MHILAFFVFLVLAAHPTLAGHHTGTLERDWLLIDKSAIISSGGVEFQNISNAIIIAPGQWIKVRVAPLETLRVVSRAAPLDERALQLEAANGIGIYVQQLTTGTDNGRGRILQNVEPVEQWVKLTRPAHTSESLHIDIHVSQRKARGRYTYQRTVGLPANTVELIPLGGKSTNYWAINAGQKMSVDVAGPARLLLEARYRYPSYHARSSQHFRIYTGLDDNPWQVLEFETLNAIFPALIGEQVQRIGRIEKRFVTVPAGKHILTIDSTADLFFRLRAHDASNYLLPRLNSPDRNRTSAFQAERTIASYWNIPLQELDALITGTPRQRKRAAFRLAQDNSQRDGGLIGTELLHRLSWQSPGDADLDRLISAFTIRHTFLRGLTVSDAVRRQVLSARYPTREFWRQANNLSLDHTNYALDRLTTAGGRSVFYRIETKQPARVVIPNRAVKSILRVIVDTRTLSKVSELVVRYDDGSFTRLRVDPAEVTFAPTLVARAPESAVDAADIIRLAEAAEPSLPWLAAGYVDLPLPKSVRSVEIQVGQQPLRVALQYRANRPFQLDELAYLEALRRIDDQTPIKLWQRLMQTQNLDAADQASIAQGYALQVGAFADVANAKRLTELLASLEYSAYHEPGRVDNTDVLRVLIGPFADTNAADMMREKLRTDTRLEPAITHSVQRIRSVSGPPNALEFDTSLMSGMINSDITWDLVHHYYPLVRLLRASHQRFQNSVAPISQTKLDLNEREAIELEARAHRYQQAEQWLAALEVWSVLARCESADARRAGYSGMARALFQLGEAYLAEQLLRSLLLYDLDPVIRDNAFGRLVELYRNRHDHVALQAVLATASLRIPSTPVYRMLVENLLASDRPDLAMSLALALPPSERPKHALLSASVRLGWWSVFEDTVVGLPNPEERKLWQGYRAQSERRYDAALDIWRTAGAAGEVLSTALREGLAIVEQLTTSDHTQRATALLRWEAWQRDHPGLRVWREADSVITGSAGGVTIYSSEHDLYSRAFRSEPGIPAHLVIHGPMRIRIAARVLHPTGSTAPFDGWIQLRDGETIIRYPINNDRPANSVELVDTPAYLPGRRVNVEYVVGPGRHELDVQNAQRPMAINVQAWLPVIPLKPLSGFHPPTHRLANIAIPSPTVPPDGKSVAQTIRPVWARIRNLVHWPVWWRGGNAPRTTANDVDTRDIGSTTIGSTRQHAPRPIKEDWIVPTDEQSAIRQMHALAWEAENNRSNHQRLLPRAASLAAQYPTAQDMQALLARLGQQTAWHPVRNVMQSAGSRYLDVSGWQPESPTLRVRKALLGNIPDDAHVIAGQQQFGLELNNLEATSFEIRLSRGDLSFLLRQPMSAYYALDQGQREVLPLTTQSPNHTFNVKVPAGAHTLYIGIDRPLPNQFLQIQVAEFDGDQRVPIAPISRRLYQVATHTEPVQLRVKGPLWLRVHELSGDQLKQRYEQVADGWQTLTFHPSAPAEESLYRFYRWMIDKKNQTVTAQPIARPVPRVASFDVTLPEAAAPQSGILSGDHLRAAANGTWGIYGSGVDRRNFDEDRPGDSERFIEFGATHRFYSGNRDAHFRTELLGRARERGGPTFGVTERIDWAPPHRSINVRVAGSLFAQRPGGELRNTESAATLSTSISQQRELGQKTQHFPSARLFYRRLSLNPNEAVDVSRIDQDIFSDHKTNHRRGLSIADTFLHRPWMDTRWYAMPGLVTNDDFDPFDPDYLQVRFGWKQLFGNWELDARYRIRRYLADANRVNSFTQHLLRMEFDWNPWIVDSNTWQANMRFSHDFDSSQNSLRFSLIRPLGNARSVLRHYRPGEINFLDVRRAAVTPTDSE